jgi:hypothetical protein
MNRIPSARLWILLWCTLALVVWIGRIAYSWPAGSFSASGQATRSDPLPVGARVEVNEQAVPPEGLDLAQLATNAVDLQLGAPAMFPQAQSTTASTQNATIRFQLQGPFGYEGQTRLVFLLAEASAYASAFTNPGGDPASASVTVSFAGLSPSASASATEPDQTVTQYSGVQRVVLSEAVAFDAAGIGYVTKSFSISASASGDPTNYFRGSVRLSQLILDPAPGIDPEDPPASGVTNEYIMKQIELRKNAISPNQPIYAAVVMWRRWSEATGPSPSQAEEAR